MVNSDKEFSAVEGSSNNNDWVIDGDILVENDDSEFDQSNVVTMDALFGKDNDNKNDDDDDDDKKESGEFAWLEKLKEFSRLQRNQRQLPPGVVVIDAIFSIVANVIEKMNSKENETERRRNDDSVVPTKTYGPSYFEKLDQNFVHGRHSCDLCKTTPIVGYRYHSTKILNYDLCHHCFCQQCEKEHPDVDVTSFRLVEYKPDNFFFQRGNGRNTDNPIWSFFQTISAKKRRRREFSCEFIPTEEEKSDVLVSEDIIQQSLSHIRRKRSKSESGTSSSSSSSSSSSLSFVSVSASKDDKEKTDVVSVVSSVSLSLSKEDKEVVSLPSSAASKNNDDNNNNNNNGIISDDNVVKDETLSLVNNKTTDVVSVPSSLSEKENDQSAKVIDKDADVISVSSSLSSSLSSSSSSSSSPHKDSQSGEMISLSSEEDHENTSMVHDMEVNSLPSTTATVTATATVAVTVTATNEQVSQSNDLNENFEECAISGSGVARADHNRDEDVEEDGSLLPNNVDESDRLSLLVPTTLPIPSKIDILTEEPEPALVEECASVSASVSVNDSVSVSDWKSKDESESSNISFVDLTADNDCDWDVAELEDGFLSNPSESESGSGNALDKEALNDMLKVCDVSSSSHSHASDDWDMMDDNYD